MPIEVHRAPPVDPTARVLAEAFLDEPGLCWIAGPGPAGKQGWFAATVHQHARLPTTRRYLALDEDTALGAALVTPPGARPGLPGQLLWSARVAKACGPGAIRRTLAYLAASEPIKPSGSWTLEFIGVRPVVRGRGVGRALLEQILIDTAGVDLFLTTADPANAALYRHFGWRDAERFRIGPVEGLAMHRPGRQPEAGGFSGK